MAQPLRVKPDAWKTINLGETLGLDLTGDTEHVEEESLLQAVNLAIRGNYLETDYGLQQYLHGVMGNPRAVAKIILTTGTTETYLITNLTVYRRLTGAWKPIGVTTATTLSGNEAQGQTVISLTSSAGFADGNVVGILLDDNTWHTALQVGAPAGNDITISIALPSAAASGKAVVEGILLSGSDDNPVHWDAVPFSDDVAFTNGVNNVKVINGATFVVADITDLPTNTKCVSLRVWDNSLFLFNTVENGTRFPRRTRWSAAGDITDWTTANDAGYRDLHDSSDELQNGFVVGPYLAIYRTNSITRFHPTGNALNRFESPTVIHGRGALCSGAIVSVGDNKHLFVHRDNVYTYEGGFDTTSVGDMIAREFLGEDGRMEKLHVGKMFLTYSENDHKANIFYADGMSSDGYPNRCFILNTKNGKWTERVFSQNISGFGHTIETTLSYIIQDLVGSIAQQTWKLGNTNTSTARPLLLLCAPGDDTTLLYGPQAADDDGAAQSITIETKDFGTPHMRSLIDNLIMQMSGGATVTVLYSLDKGDSWLPYDTEQIATTKVSNVKFWKQVTFEHLRFRITVTGYVRIAGIAFKTRLLSDI